MFHMFSPVKNKEREKKKCPKDSYGVVGGMLKGILGECDQEYWRECDQEYWGVLSGIFVRNVGEHDEVVRFANFATTQSLASQADSSVGRAALPGPRQCS